MKPKSEMRFALVAGVCLASSAAGPVVFHETFDNDDIARKPASSVVYDGRNSSRRIQNPSIIEGKDGVLVAAWSDKGPSGDNDVSDVIFSSWSADKGKTWSTPAQACPPSAINPTFIRAHNGDAVLFFNKNHSTIQDDTGIAFRRSSDNGRTWSEITEVGIGARVAILVHNGLVLPSGEWLIAFQYDRSGQGEPFDLSKIDFVAAVALSRDEGKTWRRYGAIEIPNLERSPNVTSFAVEPAVYPTGPASLGMIIRTRNGYLYQSNSVDAGHTWSPAFRLPFSNDNSKPAALTLSNGHVMMFWNDMSVVAGPLRFPLMASLSTDRGRTWPYTITMEDDQVQLDYPTAIETGGTVKVVYGYGLRQVRLVDLSESDFQKRWSLIDSERAWSVHAGVLRFSADKDIDHAIEWLRWSKAVAFLPNKPAQYTLEADIRFDASAAADGALAIFPAYQDEANWIGWVWKPWTGKIGFDREEHFGSQTRPNYSRNISETFFETLRPELNQWYRVRVETQPGRMKWTLFERETNRVLLAAENPISTHGSFVALGAQGVKASFDNITLR